MRWKVDCGHKNMEVLMESLEGTVYKGEILRVISPLESVISITSEGFSVNHHFRVQSPASAKKYSFLLQLLPGCRITHVANDSYILLKCA